MHFLRIVLFFALFTNFSLAEVSDLPLREGAIEGIGGVFALILADKLSSAEATTLTKGFHENYVPTVSWSLSEYFWKNRDTDEASADLERALTHYFVAWNRLEVILVGSGVGAGLLPFMANRLSPELKKRISVIALMDPAETASFKPHARRWPFGIGKSDLAVEPEINKVESEKLIVFRTHSGQDSREVVLIILAKR